ncbi:hypothetical protein ACLESO_06105 [Pyxidicoccus sp. 3LG]
MRTVGLFSPQRTRRGETLIEALLLGLLLCLFLGATVMLSRRFVAPAHQPFILGAALLVLGAYAAFVAAHLRRLGRTASLWAEAGRRAQELRAACADFARELPEGQEWSAKRGLLEGAVALTPETRQHLARAAQRFEQALRDQRWASVDTAPGELIVRRVTDRWQFLWRGEEGEERIHSEGPLPSAPLPAR